MLKRLFNAAGMGKFNAAGMGNPPKPSRRPAAPPLMNAIAFQ